MRRSSVSMTAFQLGLSWHLFHHVRASPRLSKSFPNIFIPGLDRPTPFASTFQSTEHHHLRQSLISHRPHTCLVMRATDHLRRPTHAYFSGRSTASFLPCHVNESLMSYNGSMQTACIQGVLKTYAHLGGTFPLVDFLAGVPLGPASEGAVN